MADGAWSAPSLGASADAALSEALLVRAQAEAAPADAAPADAAPEPAQLDEADEDDPTALFARSTQLRAGQPVSSLTIARRGSTVAAEEAHELEEDVAKLDELEMPRDGPAAWKPSGKTRAGDVLAAEALATATGKKLGKVTRAVNAVVRLQHLGAAAA